MALPTTGPISLGQVKEELNKTGSISLGSTDVRNLAGKTSGQISLSDLYGKSAATWVKVGNTDGLGVIMNEGSGEDEDHYISEAIDTAISDCSSSISSEYGVSIRPEFTLGATVYSSNKLAKTITTKAITERIPRSKYRPATIEARIEVDVYKFQ